MNAGQYETAEKLFMEAIEKFERSVQCAKVVGDTKTAENAEKQLAVLRENVGKCGYNINP